MATVTVFRRYFHRPDSTTTVVYGADYTFPDVPDEVAQAIAASGCGEIVPDAILDEPEDQPEPVPVKPGRRKNVRSAWDR
ncbi:hypothetical protein [Brevundimonas sp.]|uniref:hypothetical protein n=1 Tax=Brevundimonas sp. TaxID=1871086 RepID=UPI0035AEA00A